jgi:hypothetical protein
MKVPREATKWLTWKEPHLFCTSTLETNLLNLYNQRNKYTKKIFYKPVSQHWVREGYNNNASSSTAVICVLDAQNQTKVVALFWGQPPKENFTNQCPNTGWEGYNNQITTLRWRQAQPRAKGKFAPSWSSTLCLFCWKNWVINYSKMWISYLYKWCGHTSSSLTHMLLQQPCNTICSILQYLTRTDLLRCREVHKSICVIIDTTIQVWGTFTLTSFKLVTNNSLIFCYTFNPSFPHY